MSEEMQDLRIVALVDEMTGESLKMQIFMEIEVDNKMLALLTPHEAVVNILHTKADDDDAELAELEPSDFPKVAKDVQKALAEWTCKIEVRADEFILLGDPPQEFYDDVETIEVETEDGDDELLVLMEIDTGDDVYLIVTSSTPPIFPAELLENDTARSLNDEELAKHNELFKTALQEAAVKDAEA